MSKRTPTHTPRRSNTSDLQRTGKLVARAALAAMVSFAGIARAHESPPGCAANRVNVEVSRDQTIIVEPATVTYGLRISNGGADACDVIVGVIFHCPGPDGQPTGAMTAFATRAIPGGPSITIENYPSTPCLVDVNPGVDFGVARFEVTGTIDDSPNDSFFDNSKDLGLSIEAGSVSAETPAGSYVTVTTGAVTTTFSDVSVAGATTATPINPPSAGTLPGSYSISNLGIAYEISTTATFSGNITLGFIVPTNIDEGDFNMLRVLHGEGGATLVDRTFTSLPSCTVAPGSPCPAPDYPIRTVYAQVSSLSPFVLAVFDGPTIDEIAVPADPVAVFTTVNVQAGFTDPGSHTAVWSWGDGNTSPGIVTESGGIGTVFGSHVYEVAGVYQVTVTVTDGGGAFQDRTSLFIVVYDPNGGFVTGGGWINSPEGAYIPSPLLTGKANFGFVSKYRKNAAPGAPPEGETQFHFSTAGFKFDSDAYEWLVISGTKARYRGTGTVDGVAGYDFELTAYDNSPDRFRIKIWFGNPGNVIYDNQVASGTCLDTSDGAIPCSVLGSGSIVIHKK